MVKMALEIAIEENEEVGLKYIEENIKNKLSLIFYTKKNCVSM